MCKKEIVEDEYFKKMYTDKFDSLDKRFFNQEFLRIADYHLERMIALNKKHSNMDGLSDTGLVQIKLSNLNKGQKDILEKLLQKGINHYDEARIQSILKKN